MYKVLKIDGPNLTTDKGCIGIAPFQYADGGRSKPVSDDDFLMMRRMFIAAPDLLAACEAVEALFAGQDESRRTALCNTMLREVRAAVAKAKGE